MVHSSQHSQQHANGTHQQDPRSRGQKAIAGMSLFTRHRLEELGSWLDVIHHKRQPALSFHPADLSIGHDSLFREQAEQALKSPSGIMGKLFTNDDKFSAYNDFVKKMFPNANFPHTNIDKSIDFVFNQIASLAEKWSRTDIIGEKRFANVMQLNEQQRHDLARQITNQNRALATLGGVTGLSGLAGLLADSLWLLLVSLRTIYQLSMVYGKPLSGKNGRQTAYAIISSSDLSSMRQKQTILTGLAVANTILKNANTHGLQHSLKTAGKKHPSISGYVDDIEQIVEQLTSRFDAVNLDKLSPDTSKLSRLAKLLSLSSVAVGIHFNSHLIEEVIGVTQATLAPEYKLAKVGGHPNEC